MARVNLISYSAAEKIAEDYLTEPSVSVVYITRDGNVFYHHTKSFMTLHNRNKNLQEAWCFQRGDKVKVEEPKGKIEVKDVSKVVPEKKVTENETPKTKQQLIPLFEQLTKRGKIEKSEWENLKTAELRKKYEEIIKK